MKKKTYSGEFKEQAVRLVLEQGLSVRQACNELDVSYSAMGKWLKERRRGEATKSDGSGQSAEQQEIRALEKKVRILEMERDILKKATAFFAKESL